MDRWEGQTLGKWTIHKHLGSGGNGDVYRAAYSDSLCAIKILKPALWGHKKRYRRFTAEVEGMKQCQGILGVLPLFDYNIPKNPSYTDPPWIAMGLASPLPDIVGASTDLEQVIKACHDIARALAEMHQRGISHRDIKPDNLFFYQEQWVVGDFGLVDFENKTGITAKGEKLGPAFYIAPEMLNSADTADGKLADVYSFSKTLWVLGTGQRFPLPGEMTSSIAAMRISTYVAHNRAHLLNPIIEAGTSFEPARRPSMRDIARELEAWMRPLMPSLSDGNEFDLSKFEDEIRAVNIRHHIEEKERQETQQVRDRYGRQVRESFRKTADGIYHAIRNAGFLNVRMDFDNHFWGFDIRGHILSTVWRGEVELRVHCNIYPSENGQVSVKVQYVIVQMGERASHPSIFWEDAAAFLAGGAEEKSEVNKLITGLGGNLKLCVEHVLTLSRGAK